MNVSLPPEVEDYVAERVGSGIYPSVGDMILAGLKLLKEREERVAELRREVQIGIDQADLGRVSPFNEATLEEARCIALARLQASRREVP